MRREMTLEEIQQHWDKDSEVDRTELGNEATKIPQLHSKYFKMFSAERLKLKQLEGKAKILHFDLWTYYQGSIDHDTLKSYGWDQNDHIILKQDIPMHIEANRTHIDSNLGLSYQREKVDFLEAIIKSLNGRGFNISAAINWEKFKVGI
jgi:hypothetical protein